MSLISAGQKKGLKSTADAADILRKNFYFYLKKIIKVIQIK